MRVYSYTVEGSHHCKEGWAVETESGVLLDTYWGSDRSRLSKEEISSALLQFDTDDFEPVDHNRPDGTPAEWLRYAPEDRNYIPSQHGLRIQWFVRRGAVPDLATEIENKRNELEEAREALGSAQYRVDRAAQELIELTARSS